MIRRFFLRVCGFAIKVLLSLRYRIEVQGKELLEDERLKHKGVLVLPNHSAEVEPFMILMLASVKFDLQPLVVDNFYNMWIAKPFMRLVRAKPVAEFENAVSDYKLQEAKKLFQGVVDDLKKGAHILMYPGAGLKLTPEERIGGRSLAHATVQEAKDTEILLIRVSGLWGSKFSKVYTEGKTPNFLKELMRGALIVLQNGIFFTPRRKVTIEFSLPPENFPKHGTRLEFNRALEKFYNQFITADGKRVEKEPLYQVPYYFWSEKVPDPRFALRKKNEYYHGLSVPNHIKQDIMYQLSELSGKSVKEIHEQDDLVYDVGLDSLNIASIYTHLESHYEVEKDLQPADLKIVQDLFAAAMHMKKGGEDSVSAKAEGSSWPAFNGKRPAIFYPKTESKTLIETFLRTCDRMKKRAACSDAVSGVLTYDRMKTMVVILARKIEKLEGDYIGIMLPSSVGVQLVIQACMLAGKVPVPLNWTVGPYFMNHASDLMELKVIISSAKFLQKLDNVDLGKAIEKIVLMEDLRKGITLKDKIQGALIAKCGATKIMKSFPARKLQENDLAVVLFTSGTTALPKAVPLTHLNLLCNQACAIEMIDLNQEDVLIMPLPPFHIFGLNIGMLPLLVGCRVVYTPDPLDGSSIAKEVLKWRVSIIVMAPTFFSHLFRVATISQLKSLRVFVSGAEKAPAALMDYIHKLGDVYFIEGYGLTETSPIIAVNSVHSRPRGVGKIIPGVEAIIIDSETKEVLSQHKIGELCVRGDSIFKGYYKQDNSTTFVEINGKQYYKTGDLGYLDDDNYLYLQGRLKLSFKKGGEMISVAAIEAALFQKAKEKGWVSPETTNSPFACVPKEVPQGAPKVVLFSEIDLALDQVNSALLETGFSRLYKVNEVIVIPEIPLLKTGKVCYRKLFEMLSEKSPTKMV